MTGGIIILYLIVTTTIIHCDASCNTLTDCITCTAQKSWTQLNQCRWCPLDLQCHAYGSLRNPCSTQNVKEPARCYDVENGKYKPDAAYSFLLMSAAAYSDDPEGCLEKIYPDSGIKMYKFALSNCESFPLFTYKECFAFIGISVTMKTIVIAFRGTAKTQQLLDEAVTTIFSGKEPFIGNGNVQRYFKNAFKKFTPCFQHELKKLFENNPDYSTYEVVVTGHSLGGALASLQAITLANQKLVSKELLFLFTFGMPRVGDKNYASLFDTLVKNSFHVVHYNDIVPYIPTKLSNALPGPYHHKKEVFYSEEEMHVNSSYELSSVNEDPNLRNSLGLSCSISDMTSCIENHRYYFSINVGGLCEMSGRSKRSSDEEGSRMRPYLKNTDCTIIDPSMYAKHLYGDNVNRANIASYEAWNYVAIIPIFIFVFVFCCYYLFNGRIHGI